MRHRKLAGLAALVGLVVLGVLAVAPAAPAKTPGCSVVIKGAKPSYKTLQAAVDAATAGDTLAVKGTCVGTTTIDKNLTIAGPSKDAAKIATLDGGGQGSVLTVCAATTLNNLVITGGTGTDLFHTDNICPSQNFFGGFSGGGILALADVTLNNSTVTHNNVTAAGGGIWVDFAGVTLNDSTVSNNSSAGGGGGFEINQFGAATLNGTSSVDHNTAGVGGGVENTGTFTMNDTSTVHDNTAGFEGGGILNSGGTLNGAVAGTNVYNNHPDNISST